MSTIQRVLFPVDFSLGCQALVPTVRRMIESWRVEVTLLHVIETHPWLGRRHELERLMAQMKMIAEEGLRSARVTCRLERGAPGERILEQIRAKGVDLVVMSAGGSSTSYGSPLGSVADRILADAPCSVWLDWGSARSRFTAGMYARQVACALTLNGSDESVLRQAAEISAQLEAGLTVIHAVCPAPGKAVLALWDRGVLDKAKGRIDALLRRFHPAADVALEVGSCQTVVNRIIQDQEMGLLVTGNMREAILGAVRECPVLRLAIPAASSVSVGEPEPRYAVAERRSA